MSNAKDFVENFRKGVDIMVENIPEWLTFGVFIYARDTKEKNKEFPDGDIRFNTVSKINEYDKFAIDRFMKKELLDIE